MVANNGDISLSVNGKEVTVAKAASPRKGYLMLESEGSEAHFRNLRIKELPSTDPQPEEIASEAEGFVPLFTGLDFRGWKVPEGDNGHWKVVNEVIDYDAESESPPATRVSGASASSGISSSSWTGASRRRPT